MTYTVHRRCTECGTAYSYESGDNDRCPRCSLARGIEQAAAGQLEDRGSFAKHVEDHSCTVTPDPIWRGADDWVVTCTTCGELSNTGAMDASDARGVARRHEQWYRNHAATEHA